MQDEVLGPFFINELGDDIEDEDWVEHIDLLADFWLAELMDEPTYIGNFVGAHIKVQHINRESFKRWLELFSQTAETIYSDELATRFKKKAKALSAHFIAKLAI